MEDTISVLCTDNHHSYPLADLSPVNDSPELISLSVNCQSLLAKRKSFINLIVTHDPDIVFGTESWHNYYQVNYSQLATLSITGTEKMAMAMFHCLSKISHFM